MFAIRRALLLRRFPPPLPRTLISSLDLDPTPRVSSLLRTFSSSGGGGGEEGDRPATHGPVSGVDPMSHDPEVRCSPGSTGARPPPGPRGSPRTTSTAPP
uniref:Uncharacterized protein n=1 Tax=Ananas comosus var. bracteatus TaxID=296719 RepID=A0A6V7PGG6_ANACO|nr:unnamed protein product [Ananas comosus var. bracteatus]